MTKLKTDGQKFTIYYPQILRWMFEQKDRFSFQVKGTQIESINNVLDVSELTGMGTNTQDGQTQRSTTLFQQQWRLNLV